MIEEKKIFSILKRDKHKNLKLSYLTYTERRCNHLVKPDVLRNPLF